MPDIDRRVLIAVPIIAVVFLLGFALGRGTAGDGDSAAADNQASTSSIAGTATQNDPATGGSEDGSPATTLMPGDPTVVIPTRPTTPGDIPQYGTAEERQALIAGLVEAGVSGGPEADILATADYVCYTLERLQAQRRSLSFTVRVVWNDSLAELPPEDLAAFGAVLSAAPAYLCPESAARAESVSYWLGY